MKVLKTSIIILAMFATFHSKSQNCNEVYYASKVGTKLTYENKDEKGKLTATQETTIKAIKNTADGSEISISSTMKDGKGKMIAENMAFDVTCTNGTIKLRFSDMMMASMSQMKDMEMEITGDGVQYPSELKEGQELPNGESNIKIKASGLTLMTIQNKEISRIVEKKESVTTSAGTFDCFKIVSQSEMKMMGKRKYKSAMWFSKGVGIVKMESYNDKNELNNVMLLTKLEK